MKAILYTVNTPNIGGAWFYVSPEQNVKQVRNGNEYQDWLACGAIERVAESQGHFIEMLSTFQPVGALGTQGSAVLGVAGTNDWLARNKITVTVPPIVVPPVTVTVPDMVLSGTISS